MKQPLQIVECMPGIAADTLSLELGDSLRHLPGRRQVFTGKWVEAEIDVVAKCYEPHAKQVRDWRREWAGLRQLAERALPGPEPLAAGRAVSGEVYVIMRRIEGAVTLGKFVEQATDGVQHKILGQLPQLVDRMHRSGVRQMDQHIDNWAVADGSIYLLDAGTYRFEDKPLSESDRLTDLAYICVTLPPHAERIFRGVLALGAALDRRLEQKIRQVQRGRARRYFKKTRRPCTEFEPRDSNIGTGMAARGACGELLERFFDRPDALMGEGDRLKAGNTCTVQQFKFAGQSYVLKRYNQKPRLTRLRRALVPSRARRSWSNGWVLQLAFIPTAQPVAFLDAGGFPRSRSYLLMQSVPGDLLPDYIERYQRDVERMRVLVERVGSIWDALGRLRAVHGDMKATNWIVDASGKVYLFDLDSLRFGLSGRRYRSGRQQDMERFLQNWTSHGTLANAFASRLSKTLSE